MIVEASIEIAAPATRIWETFADLSSWQRWNSVLRGVKYRRSDHLAVGTTFTCTIQPFGVPIPFEAVVTEAQPPMSVVWETRKPGLTARHTFLCEEEGGLLSNPGASARNDDSLLHEPQIMISTLYTYFSEYL